MTTIKKRIITQTIAFIVFIILITTFIGVMGGKFERVQQAAYAGDYQAIQQETEVFSSMNKTMQTQAKKAFGILAAILIVFILATYALQGGKERTYIKTLKAVANLHHLSFYQENRLSYPTVTGSDDQGIILIEITTSDKGKKKTIVTLGVNQTETMIINAKGEHEIIGSKRAREKVTSIAKKLLDDTEGAWYLRAGELRYEHPTIAENEEQLTSIITAAKKLRKDLT